MAREPQGADFQDAHRSDVCATIVKSSLTGVAATMAVVAVCSPAGLGGMIGTSVASGLGIDTVDVLRPRDGVVTFPDLRAPLSNAELDSIRGRLADCAFVIESARASTDATIDMLRTIASDPMAFSVAHDYAQEVTPRESDVELARLLLASSSSSTGQP